MKTIDELKSEEAEYGDPCPYCGFPQSEVPTGHGYLNVRDDADYYDALDYAEGRCLGDCEL
jgi:hypothetical protein